MVYDRGTAGERGNDMKPQVSKSDAFFVAAASIYFIVRDGASEYSTVADIAVLGALIYLALKYLTGKGK